MSFVDEPIKRQQYFMLSFYCPEISKKINIIDCFECSKYYSCPFRNY